jgi:hypothetical protein
MASRQPDLKVSPSLHLKKAEAKLKVISEGPERRCVTILNA